MRPYSIALGADEGSLYRNGHREIDEVYSYIAKDNLAAADRVIGQVRHTIALVGKRPKIGHVKYRQFVRMLPVRRYPQYLVFYAIEGNEVVVLNVRHGARRRPWEDDS